MKYWLQDEDTLEEGFYGIDDEQIFCVMADNEAFLARRFKKGRKPRMHPGSPGRAKGGKTRDEANLGSFPQKREPTKQTEKIRLIPTNKGKPGPLESSEHPASEPSSQTHHFSGKICTGGNSFTSLGTQSP